MRHVWHGLRTQLLNWARRWNLLDPRGRIPNWLAQQVADAFSVWNQWWPQDDDHAPRCWPLISSDWWCWAPTDSRCERKAARYARRHPQFDPGVIRRNDEWLHRHWSRYVALVAAPRIELAHFGWAVEFQCAGARISEIANRLDANVSCQAIYHAVRRTLQLCGLAARRDKPGPRRRSRSGRDS